MSEIKLPSADTIRTAAEKCPQAREILQELFPEVFVCDNKLDLRKLEIKKYADRWYFENIEGDEILWVGNKEYCNIIIVHQDYNCELIDSVIPGPGHTKIKITKKQHAVS